MATQVRREQDRARRRQDILLAARAVFAQHGARRATVEQIAQRAELAKGTIYLYFESKEAILAELVLEALADLTLQLQAAGDSRPPLQPDERLRAMAGSYLSFARQSPDYFRMLTAFDSGVFHNDLSPDRRERMRSESDRALSLVAQAISDGVSLGLFTSEDTRQSASIIWAALNGALALMANPMRRQLVASDVDSLCHAALELCLRGLACPRSADLYRERELVEGQSSESSDQRSTS